MAAAGEPGARLGAARAVNIGLRTLHLLAMALAVGAARWAHGSGGEGRWLVAAALTGAGLLVVEAWASRGWVVQVRGLAALAHMGVAGLAHLGAGSRGLLVALVIGAVGSHLPKGLRKWSVARRTTVV